VSELRRLRIFRTLAIVAATAAYVTIVVGGNVSSSGAGMACGDAWPFCSTGIIPDFSKPGVPIEFAHRVAAFVTSLMILAVLAFAYLWYRRDRNTIALAAASMVLLVSQVWLGMETVAQNLSPALATAHLAVGTATFATALSLAVVVLVAPPGRSSLNREVDEGDGDEPDHGPQGPSVAAIGHGDREEPADQKD
jgi:cytochrome c oxidase assembly protein subunit 15